MKKFYKVTAIIAAALLISGVILISVGVATGGAKTEKIFNCIDVDFGGEINKQEYTKLDEFDSIKIDTDACGVKIIPSDDYGIEYAVYTDDVNYSIIDKKLTFNENHKKSIGINFNFSGIGRLFNDNEDEIYVKIYVPEDILFNNVDISNSMGCVDIRDLSFNNLNINADMGEVDLTNINASKLYVNESCGSVKISGKFTDNMEVSNDMGDIDIEGYLACNTDISCDSGSVDVTTYYNSKCYTYDIDVDLGDDNVNYDGGEILDNKTYKLNIEADMGDATLTFRDAE